MVLSLFDGFLVRANDLRSDAVNLQEKPMCMYASASALTGLEHSDYRVDVVETHPASAHSSACPSLSPSSSLSSSPSSDRMLSTLTDTSGPHLDKLSELSELSDDATCPDWG